MSEPQTETEQGTDAEPDFSHIHAPWHLEPSDGLDDVPEGYLAVINENDGLVGYAWEDDAPIIAAAGTAAQEAKEMGYDALSFILNSAHLLRELENIANGDIEDGMTPAEVAQNALASAEGSTQQAEDT